MADFSIPFGRDAEKRLPTQAERENGFPCGPASQILFNGMFNRIEAELGEVISFAGLSGTDDRNTLVREAIEALIAAATGNADTSQYLLISQARSRLPIFPEIESADNKINIYSPATGTIRIPGGVNFMHRGIFPVTTVETDFSTDASKTYHIRWNTTDGYQMLDLASGTYNPNTLSEDDEEFDTKYDDMLLARVITNSSNVATITNLVNRNRVSINEFLLGTSLTYNGQNGATFSFDREFNWSRKPDVYHVSNIGAEMINNRDDHDYNIREANLDPTRFAGNLNSGGSTRISRISLNRYNFGSTLTCDGATAASIMLSLSM